LGAEELETELALTEKQMQTGMMFRTNLDENAGMLFVFRAPIRASFWMEKTFVPLAAAYIDPAGDIVEIHELKPLDTNEVVARGNNIQYVLEVNSGWFQRHHLGPGTRVRTEVGSLQQTFSGRPASR
jgi:hypothetical protein